MEKNKSLSFLQLVLTSLKVANQSFGSVLLLCILVVLCSILLVAVCGGLMILLGKSALVMLLQIPLILCGALLGIVFTSALIQIVADKIKGIGFGTLESFTSSFVPSTYFVISSILLSIPAGILLLGALFSQSVLLMVMVYGALMFAMLPFMFTQHAIVLRGEGPISGLRYSWQLASANYVRILLIMLQAAACGVVILLGIVCLVKALLPQLLSNPTMFQLKLMLWMKSLPIAYVLGGTLLYHVLQLYLVIAGQAFITAMFLHLDDLDFMRVTDPALQPLPEQPLPADTAHEPNAYTDTTPDQEPIITPEDLLSEVSITQASVSTQPDEDTTRHLDQVYRAQEHLKQAIEQEEDRMPTILFDEDMARQLAENEIKIQQQQQNKPNTQQDDGQASIKMSDKPL